MSEQAIESAAAPIIEGAVKALTPEAEAALNEIHAFASSEFQKLDDSLPSLLKIAETDTVGAIRNAESHVAAIVNALRAKLGIPYTLDIPTVTVEQAAARAASPEPTVDPTPAVPAPQQ